MTSEQREETTRHFDFWLTCPLIDPKKINVVIFLRIFRQAEIPSQESVLIGLLNLTSREPETNCHTEELVCGLCPVHTKFIHNGE